MVISIFLVEDAITDMAKFTGDLSIVFLFSSLEHNVMAIISSNDKMYKVTHIKDMVEVAFQNSYQIP